MRVWCNSAPAMSVGATMSVGAKPETLLTLNIEEARRVCEIEETRFKECWLQDNDIVRKCLREGNYVEAIVKQRQRDEMSTEFEMRCSVVALGRVARHC
jgi:hypothetical protein